MISQQTNETNTFSDGVILLDKPVDMTSFDVTRIISKAIHVKKVGHSGTLDKNATGLMIICFGKATKFLSQLIGHRKRYIGDIYFGASTTTDDSTGEITSRYEGELDFDKIKQTLKSYIGKINQIPPKYSAIHINGQRAYQLANSNKEFEIQPKEITIYNLEIKDIKQNIVTIDVDCSSGTYIRSIARDAGLDTGYFGHICALRRIEIGNFNIEQAYTIEQIKSGNFKYLTINELIQKLDYPILTLKPQFKQYFSNGKKLTDEIFETKINMGINNVIVNDNFIGMIEKTEEKISYKFVSL